MKLVIELPPLPPILFKNAERGASKWAKIGFSKEKAKLRGWAKLASIAAIQEQKPEGLPWKLATVAIHFTFKDKRSNHDRHNLIHPIQPALDGFQDAMIVANDRDFIVGLPTFDVGEKLGVRFTISKA